MPLIILLCFLIISGV